MPACRAMLSTDEDDLQVQVVPVFLGENRLEVTFRSFNIRAVGKSPPRSKAMDVGVDGEGRDAEGLGHHHARCFVAHARQGLQLFEGSRHRSIMPFQQEFGQTADVFRLGRRQTDEADDRLNLFDGQRGHVRRGGSTFKQRRRDFVHLEVRGLRRHQDGHKELEGVAVIERHGCLRIPFLKHLHDACCFLCASHEGPTCFAKLELCGCHYVGPFFKYGWSFLTSMTTDEERLTVVNVVASTRVAEELDLPDIAIQLNCEYEPEQFPGVVYRVVDPKLAILMFRSGRAVCTGGKDEQNIQTGIERMIADLRAAGITTWEVEDVEIEVQNMVATYALHYPVDYDGKDKFTGEPLADAPRKLNLNHLTFHLPFDKVEYEPEQFPGLIYRLDYPKVVCLIFGSGKMVITGARHKDEILEAVEIIKDELADLL